MLLRRHILFMIMVCLCSGALVMSQPQARPWSVTLANTGELRSAGQGCALQLAPGQPWTLPEHVRFECDVAQQYPALYDESGKARQALQHTECIFQNQTTKLRLPIRKYTVADPVPGWYVATLQPSDRQLPKYQNDLSAIAKQGGCDLGVWIGGRTRGLEMISQEWDVAQDWLAAWAKAEADFHALRAAAENTTAAGTPLSYADFETKAREIIMRMETLRDDTYQHFESGQMKEIFWMWMGELTRGIGVINGVLAGKQMRAVPAPGAAGSHSMPADSATEQEGEGGASTQPRPPAIAVELLRFNRQIDLCRAVALNLEYHLSGALQEIEAATVADLPVSLDRWQAEWQADQTAVAALLKKLMARYTPVWSGEFADTVRVVTVDNDLNQRFRAGMVEFSESICAPGGYREMLQQWIAATQLSGSLKMDSLRSPDDTVMQEKWQRQRNTEVALRDALVRLLNAGIIPEQVIATH